MLLSDALVEGSGDNVILLLFSELYEVYSVARYTNCELRILLGMLLSVYESFSVENIYIKMMTAFFNVAVEQANEIVDLIVCSCHITSSFH